MRGLFSLAWAAALVATVAASGGTQVTPGGVDDIVITAESILNSTTKYIITDNAPPQTIQDAPASNSGSTHHTDVASTASAQLPMTIVNNFGNGMYMYITGADDNGNACFVGSSGGYIYPPASGSVPQPITASIGIALGNNGQTTSFTLPGTLQSARIWFAAGQLKFYSVTDGNGNGAIVMPSAVNPSDPNAGVQWGFVEFNYDSSSMFANISYVDFVGLPLGMGLTVGGVQQVVEGLKGMSVNNICSDLTSQSNSDGQIWSKLCQYSGSKALRALSPNLYISGNSGAFSGYFEPYVNSVWSQYTSSALTIAPQNGGGNVACQVSGSTLNCAGDNRGYPKPTTADIFGCNSGPFAIESGDNSIHYAVVPRLCAAFDRSTLLLSGGNVQPSLGSSSYYTVSPTNHYSRIVHNYEVGGLGYAFSYDDVSPNGQNVAGTVSGNNPTNFKITIGGWS
ncbi:glycoside hydrolase family 64 protein [Xylariaceae sp. FL0255]|nr:glycoside hydrolase family 64 protein [Xylariaceae sp. FL0255]